MGEVLCYPQPLGQLRGAVIRIGNRRGANLSRYEASELRSESHGFLGANRSRGDHSCRKPDERSSHIVSLGDGNGHLRVDGGCEHDRAHSNQHSSRSYGSYFLLASVNRLLVADRAVPRLRKDSPAIVSVESLETRVSAQAYNNRLQRISAVHTSVVCSEAAADPRGR